MSINPHIKPKFGHVQLIMLDVLVALLPMLFAGYMAYGMVVLQQIGIAITVALATEFLFAALLLRKYRTITDGSALVSALLLVCIISPVTPWYVVAFGAFSAVLFGKIVWGGIGKNRFNPALVGREFMSVFFAAVMTSPNIWKTQDLVHTRAADLFPGMDIPLLSDHLNMLVYKTSGAMGEYSIVAIVLGGLYLLLRNRITWHVPFSLLASFTVLTWVAGSEGIRFSLSGLLLGTIYMATDMPSSPTTANGKLYYGLMIGFVLFILIKGGVHYEYMSYAILLLNGFSEQVSQTFKPRPWAAVLDWKKKIEEVFLLTMQILGASLAVSSLHYFDLINYLVFTYIVYIIIKFNFSFTKTINNPI